MGIRNYIFDMNTKNKSFFSYEQLITLEMDWKVGGTRFQN